ncbi:hypothetical protein MINTM005_01380 [Mycobacterium intracellulare]|uniref:Uncharacterized protein n=1 Tax=Mycobacterium paraintracellulare TaxID=1138383 RepID=A0ABN6AP92_9MYCO|nr:hypothetical protein MPRI_20030 [Mycobacterium paraintracellulare]BCO54894.1 hypothetical protein MINTM005_01380 [Mycobacterium intracellulare]BCO65527.1 hypothetical protein MINTM007_01380 [Mycobacterium intracellulare]
MIGRTGDAACAPSSPAPGSGSVTDDGWFLFARSLMTLVSSGVGIPRSEQYTHEYLRNGIASRKLWQNLAHG